MLASETLQLAVAHTLHSVQILAALKQSFPSVIHSLRSPQRGPVAHAPYLKLSSQYIHLKTRVRIYSLNPFSCVLNTHLHSVPTTHELRSFRHARGLCPLQLASKTLKQYSFPAVIHSLRSPQRGPVAHASITEAISLGYYSLNSESEYTRTISKPD
jgi:hypothetical protein